MLGTSNPAVLMTKHLGQEALHQYAAVLQYEFRQGRSVTTARLHSAQGMPQGVLISSAHFQAVSFHGARCKIQEYRGGATRGKAVAVRQRRPLEEHEPGSSGISLAQGSGRALE